MEREENSSQQTKYCSNCKRDINESTFVLHESHCKRHITLCEICEEPVSIREKDEHFQENHAPVACTICGQLVPKDTLDDHKDQCPERKIECKYCELDMKAKDYEEHVEMCGSRTEICEMCGQRIMLKDLDEHKMVKCASVRAESPLDPNTLENLDFSQQEYYGDSFEYDPYSNQYGHHGDEYGYYGNDYGHHGGEYGDYGDRYNHYGNVHDYEQGQNGGESHAYPTDPQAPPPPYPGDDSITVDPQWLETVAKACGEENLDRVLAQNVFYMNMRQATARDEYQPIEREVMEEGVAADRQREWEQQQVHRDEDIARQLQHQFDNKRLEEERDAELARQLQQQMGQPPSAPHDNNSQPLVSDFERDAQLAERLQEEEHFQERGLSASSPPPHITESDAELARRLQMEEDRSSAMKYKQKGVTPSDEFTYGSSYSHSPGSNTYASYNEPPVQYNNDRRAEGGYGYEESHPTPYSVHSNPYNPLYGDDEQPRSKTPPPTRPQRSKNWRGSKSEDLPYKEEEEKIPCQFCQKLISFAQIMYHQKQCTADYYATTTSTGHTEQYNVDALLRENSPDEETSPASTIPCQFCGDQFTENLIVPHQALCEHNPDKHLKDAYHPERTRRPHPHPLEGPVRETVHSLQRPPLHAEEQDPEIPCEFCGAGFPSSRINNHQLTCTKNRDLRPTLTASGSMASPEEVEVGPCEFCRQQLPITELIKHEATCQLQHSASHVSAPQSESSFQPPLQPTSSTHKPPFDLPSLQPTTSGYTPLLEPATSTTQPTTGSHMPSLEPTTSTYKPSFDPITSTYIHQPSLQPTTCGYTPLLESATSTYVPSLQPTTGSYMPSLGPTTSTYKPSFNPVTSTDTYRPLLQPITSIHKPSLEPTAGSHAPSLEPTTSSSIVQPVKPPRTNGPQMAIRFPRSSNTTGFSISPGALKPASPPEILSTSAYLAQTTTVPKLQSINTTPPTIAASVAVGSGYRPPAAAVHTTPAHTTSLSSTSIYKAPSASEAVNSADINRKRHITSTGSSPDLGSKIPRLVPAGSGHFSSPLISKLAAGTPAYGGHNLASNIGVDPTSVSSVTQQKYGTTAPRPEAHTPARSIPLSSQRQELGSAYIYQHPTATTNPLPLNQVLTKPPSTTNYNFLTVLTPETSSIENQFLPSSTQGTVSPTYPSITAALPSLSSTTTSSLQQYSPLSSSPSSTGSTPVEDTPNLTPSLGSSQLPGGSLTNRGGGSSDKVNQYTKNALKGGKGKGKGKHCNDVLSSVSITPNPHHQPRQSPISPQTDGPWGGSSRSIAAQSSTFTGYSQEKSVNVQSSTGLSPQPGTQRVQRETLFQNPSQPAADAYTTTANPPPLKSSHLANSAATSGRESRIRGPQHPTRNRTGSSSSYLGVKNGVTSQGNSVRGKETGLEHGLTNLKLSSTGDAPSNWSVKPTPRSSQKSGGNSVQLPANPSSTHKPKKREEQSPDSASQQRTAQKSGKSVPSSGATQKLSTPTPRSASPRAKRPPQSGSTYKQDLSIKSTTTLKGSPLAAETASRSPRNPQLQHRMNRGRSKSGSRKPNVTSTATSPTSYSAERVHSQPQTGRNTSSRGKTSSTRKT